MCLLNCYADRLTVGAASSIFTYFCAHKKKDWIREIFLLCLFKQSLFRLIVLIQTLHLLKTRKKTILLCYINRKPVRNNLILLSK